MIVPRGLAAVGRRGPHAVILLACALSPCAPSAPLLAQTMPASPAPAQQPSPTPSPATPENKNATEQFQELPALPMPRTVEPESAPQKTKGSRQPPVEANEEQKPAENPEGEAVKEEKQATKEPWFSAHEQGTIITQEHGRFHSPYIGPHSLLPIESAATTETATLYLDGRLWRGADIVFDPEISGGRGFSGTQGVAGFPNGEATRVGEVEPTPYIARLFVRQTWGFDGEAEKLEDDANQIPELRDVNHFTLSAGKMAATDVADNNRYSHDPRTQFMNWSIMDNGAWDYPANVRGYTYGIAADLSTMYWALHYGIFAEPAEANGAALDPRFLMANGQILELEERYTLGDHPGRLREWVFLNHAHMGNYDEALALMPVNPDITLTRAYRFKYGVGGNLEQELTKDLGLFVRAGWNDGHSESWAFTEIDRTAVVGLVLQGTSWRRPNDQVGLAGVINGISGPHRAYLAAGGLGFILGDGRLNYAPEQIVEAYYNLQIVKGINVTVDFQGINHPAYNADRGPVAVGSLRVHFEH